VSEEFDIQVGDIEVFEGIETGVTEDGSAVADMITVVVNEETGEAVIEEVIGIVTADGTEIVEEIHGVVDAAGEFHLVSDEVEVEGSDEPDEPLPPVNF